MAGSNDIIKTLKTAREAKGLSQRALATRVSLPQSHISKIESGSVDIQLSSLIELARALELELKLVPRKAVPAVESVIRHTTPASVRDREARVREALSRIEDIAGRLEEHDASLHLDDIREIAHFLRQIPLSSEDLRIIETVVAPLRDLERVNLDTNYEDQIRFLLGVPKTRDNLKKAARALRSIRNRAVNSPVNQEPVTRPAYTLDEEDDNG